MIRMTAMERKNSYNLQDLMDCAKEKLFGPGNAKLPSPPMLMFDRITNIQDSKGKYDKGKISLKYPFSLNA